MLAAQGIVLNRRNHREPRHMAHGRPGELSSVDEHENGRAPDDAVLDGFVEMGRFLRKQASTECHLRARRDGEGRDRGVFTP